jgi:hypothetical protein
VIVVNAVLTAVTVAATPVVVAELAKYTVVVAAPTAFGMYAEQKDVKSKFALTVTLETLDASSNGSTDDHNSRRPSRVSSSININYTYCNLLLDISIRDWGWSTSLELCQRIGHLDPELHDLLSVGLPPPLLAQHHRSGHHVRLG